MDSWLVLYSVNLLEMESWTVLKECVNVAKRNLRITVGILTGHYQVNYHLGKLAISTENVCKFCKGSNETSTYDLGQYPVPVQSRLRKLNTRCQVVSRRRANCPWSEYGKTQSPETLSADFNGATRAYLCQGGASTNQPIRVGSSQNRSGLSEMSFCTQGYTFS